MIYATNYLSHAFPPLFLLLIFFYRDKFKEPIRYVFASFFLGVAIIYPLDYLIIIADYFGDNYFYNEILFLLYNSFFRAAFLEEGLKFFIIFFFCSKLIDFNEKYDALLYSAAVGLGYAGIENIDYFQIYGLEMSERLTPLFAHLGFALIMGLFLSKAIFNNLNKKLSIFLSLFIPVFLHGLHNFVLDLQYYYYGNFFYYFWIIYIAIIIVFILLVIIYYGFLQSNKISENEQKYNLSTLDIFLNYIFVFMSVIVTIAIGSFIFAY